MILPIGIGIDCRVLASVITPLVNFSLRETRSLSIHDKTRILNLHVISVISHKIQTVSNLLERDIATISNTGRALRAFLCRDQDHTIGSTRTIDSRGSCILQNRDTLDILRIDITDIISRHAIDDNQWAGIVQCALASNPNRLRLKSRCITTTVGYRKPCRQTC